MKPAVLMYHGFGARARPDDPHHLFVRTEDFDGQIRLLARRYRPLDLESYLAGLPEGRWPRRSVLVTMDDGYVSTLTVAAPILARHGVPAVLFVPPGRLGGSSGWIGEMPGEAMLTPGQLRELPTFGIEVQVHGMSHRGLPGLSVSELNQEVVEARKALADLMGDAPARTFAYPEGRFDRAAVDAVRGAGYEAAFSVFERGAGRYSITRRPITPLDSARAFRFKLAPGFDAMWRATARMPRARRVAARTAGQRRRGAAAGGTDPAGPVTGPSGSQAPTP
jgi:peptidoglycan/xylan/chitin deacetylase (PgdA/CDA1 family)